MTVQHVTCKRSKPPPPTADAACIAIDEVSQRRFLCKDGRKFAWLPLAELLAQQLARRCGLTVPDCHVIELEAKPGEFYFGSQWEGGAEDYSPGIVAKVTNPIEFSRIFAFDLLVHNVDRHMNNYLYLQLAGDTVVKAMDHSRTWWFSGWPLPPPPPPISSATMANYGHWAGQAGWNKAAAIEVVDQWLSVDQAEVSSIIAQAPADWVDATARTSLIAWWGSPDWTDRATLVKGLLP
jgi:hypothetical protein